MSKSLDIGPSTPTRTIPRVSERPGRRRLWLGLGGAGVVLLGAYAVAVLVVGDTLPRGTSVAGVPIGGLTRTEAVDRLEERVEGPDTLTVTAGEETEDVTPAEAGLTLDAEESVDQVAGSSRWSPAGLWSRLSGGQELDAAVAVDDDALGALLEGLEEQVGTEPVEGAVRLTAKGVRTREPEPGTAIDVEAAREALVAAYVGDGTAELPTSEVDPSIDAGDVEEAVSEFAEPALSGPVAFVFGESEVTLEPAQFARTLRLVPEDGELVPHLRTKGLHRLLDGLVSTDGQAPVDATVALVGGEPQVVPAKPGVTYDRAQVDAAFLDLVTAGEGERSLAVESTVAEPEVTTADAEALGVVELIATGETEFPYAEYRNINLGRAAELIDGTLVRPGEQFSLNGIVGERTAENGFTEGFVISDGIFKEDLGGGVSQMATTAFNAGFFGGMTDVEHKPHSFYIDRYPEGREATVAWPTLDMRWQNDTPYGVLVQAVVKPSTPSSQGVVTVNLYSTQYWDITTKTSERYAFTSPATRTLDTPDCYPNSGYGGFDVDVFRYWARAGSGTIERTEKMHTTYTPSDTVICKPPGSLDD